MKVFFNSSLPRSGSTLIQNILAQNPRFYCSPTSGVLELLYAARQNFTNLSEFKLQDPALMKSGWLSFCKHALEGWYAGITDRPVAVDKSRGWIYYWEFLNAFYPNPKVICCIRDLRHVLASMENLHRKNMHLHDPADNPAQMKMVTVEDRVSHWLSTPPVGLGLQRLRDAVLKGNATSFFILRHEDLLAEPQAVMQRLYAYLEEEPFVHDFDNIEQVVTEDDSQHGAYGDHVIRKKLSASPLEPEKLLSKPVCDAIRRECAWFYQRFYPELK